MDPVQVVFSIVIGLVAVSVALVWTGVVLLFGAGWGLVVGGCLLGVSASSVGAALLRESRSG